MQEQWLDDRLERKDSFMLMQGLTSQLEMLTTKGISFWKLPKGIVLRRLNANESRQRLPSGEYVVFNFDTEELFIQLPHTFLPYCYHIMCNLTDRSSINCGLLFFCRMPST